MTQIEPLKQKNKITSSLTFVSTFSHKLRFWGVMCWFS